MSVQDPSWSSRSFTHPLFRLFLSVFPGGRGFGSSPVCAGEAGGLQAPRGGRQAGEVEEASGKYEDFPLREYEDDLGGDRRQALPGSMGVAAPVGAPAQLRRCHLASPPQSPLLLPLGSGVL